MLSALFLFSGCGYRTHVPTHIDTQSALERENQALIREFEAKLYDIPLPFSIEKSQLISDVQSNPDYIVLSYQTRLPLQELIAFYQTELERLGWQQKKLFIGTDEALMVIKKPERYAAISIRHQGTSCQLVLYIGLISALSN